MKIIENITIFKCDFCKKELKRKYAMEAHELRCGNNPINDRVCLHCPHLDRKEIEFDTGISTYHGFEPVYRKAQTFYCKAKNILLLHPKTDYLKSDLSWVYLDNKETEQFPMLVDCEVYENDKNNNEIILQSLF